MSNRSISITGATGFLGWHLCQAFQTAGWSVTSVVRQGSSKPTVPGTRRVEASLLSEGELTKAVVRLLDGTRDRAALLRELLPMDPKLTAESLEDGLKRLAALAVLTA